MKPLLTLEPHFTGSSPRYSNMKKSNPQESVAFTGSSMERHAVDGWVDDTSVLDMDYFIEILSDIKAKGITPDLIGLLATHYATMWLPELSNDDTRPAYSSFENSPDYVARELRKKKIYVQTLVEIVLPVKKCVSCGFLLKLLQIGNTVGIEPTYRAEIEKMISWQLDEATLADLMIPSFDYGCRTLLDAELVHRLVHRFFNLDEMSRRRKALAKVAELVDSYLAEAAIDSNFTLPEFFALASVVPNHAQSSADGMYRAMMDIIHGSIFIWQVHRDMSKQERKNLCGLIDTTKLSTEASLHAAQNMLLPVRTVIEVLLRSISIARNQSPNAKLVPSSQSPSVNYLKSEHGELKKLHEDVCRLEFQCYSLKVQLEKICEKKKGFFKLMKLWVPSFDLWKLVRKGNW